MKQLLCLFSLVTVTSWAQSNLESIKKDFGSFEGKSIQILPKDYTSTPIYKRIQQHPDHYAYLDSVSVYSMAHLSDGLFITGFVVTPKQAGTYPCIVFNRGGNRDLGQLLTATAIDILAPLAAKGYVVVATNYRGTTYSEGTDEFGGADVRDVINLIHSLGELPMVDTSRIGLFGVSRGGMMNFLALKTDPALPVKAVVNIGGVTDQAVTIAHHPAIRSVMQETVPDFDKHPEESIAVRSAINWVEELPAQVPMLLMHSMTDDHVHYSQVVQFSDSLDQHQRPYQLILFERDNHGLVQHRNYVFQALTDWFDAYVRDGKEFSVEEKRMEIK